MPPQTSRTNFIKSPRVIIGFWVILCVIFLLFAYSRSHQTKGGNSYASNGSDDSYVDWSSCNVLGVKLHGPLVTYLPDDYQGDGSFSSREITTSDEVLDALDTANNDEHIQAVILEVDSGGGAPVAGSEIAQAVSLSKKPVVAYIRSEGASSAYWAVSPAKKIFASVNSSVGSIGITSSYVEDIDPKKKYIQITSGKYKDYGNPNKKLTEEELALLQEDNDVIYNNFIQDVARYRGMPLASVKSLADGATRLGEKAKKEGLIDEIGSLFEVKDYVRTLINDDVAMCWN